VPCLLQDLIPTFLPLLCLPGHLCSSWRLLLTCPHLTPTPRHLLMTLGQCLWPSSFTSPRLKPPPCMGPCAKPVLSIQPPP
jgi:hypothetical protein